MRIVSHSERDLTNLRVAAVLLLFILWLGYEFYKFLEPDVYRLMCSWAATDEVIDAFVADVRNLLGGSP